MSFPFIPAIWIAGMTVTAVVLTQWAMMRVSLHWLLRCVDGCVKNVQLAHSDNTNRDERVILFHTASEKQYVKV